MSVNRYNPYHNAATARAQPGQYQTQAIPNPPVAPQRNFEPAVWQWVPDAPQDVQGPYRVLMSGLPTENVAKKEIIVSIPLAHVFAAVITKRDVKPNSLI